MNLCCLKLFYGNLLYTLQVASCFECRLEEFVHDFFSRLVVDESSGHYEDVGIIVLTNHVCNFGNPCQTGAHTLVLVQRHGNAFAASANADTGIDFTAFDTFSKGMSEVWIIHTHVAPCAVVFVGIAVFFQILNHKFF